MEVRPFRGRELELWRCSGAKMCGHCPRSRAVIVTSISGKVATTSRSPNLDKVFDVANSPSNGCSSHNDHNDDEGSELAP